MKSEKIEGMFQNVLSQLAKPQDHHLHSMIRAAHRLFQNGDEKHAWWVLEAFCTGVVKLRSYAEKTGDKDLVILVETMDKINPIMIELYKS